MQERLKRQLEFIIEADKMKNILRQSVICDKSRRENDAEHSWHIALIAMTLYEYANKPDIDLLHVLKMLILHDIIEIYAGDTFAFDDAANKDKAEREKKAADKIFGMLPDDQKKAYRSLWEEFEAMETPEALFAAAADRLQPFLLNCCTDGHTWVKGNVSADKVYKRLEPVKTTLPALWETIDSLVKENIEKGYIMLF